MSSHTPAGDRALLVDLGVVDAATLHASAAAVQSVGGVVACIAGERSLYVIFEAARAVDPAAVERALRGGSGAAIAPRATHVLPVSFAPECALDLPQLFARTAVDRESFLQRVAALTLHARYLGFRAGFAYLDGWPREWQLPRRDTSRSHVPAGSFAIAATRAGFYPIDSPGGWNVLGRTSATLWDSSNSPPNRIAAGDAITLAPTLDPLTPATPRAAVPDVQRPVVEVIQPGQLAAVVAARDWSRIAAGVAEGGAFDDVAAALANAAAGNRHDATLLECSLVGPTLRMLVDATLAWSGGDADLRIGDVPVDPSRAFTARRGDVLRVGRIHNALRGYLALAGGFDGGLPTCAPPRVLRARDVIGSAGSRAVTPSLHLVASRANRLQLRAIGGPHVLDGSLLRELTAREWRVTPELDRVGIRLRPDRRISTRPPADLPSIGAQCGSVQWHPDGTLVILGPDHPITGGYLQPLTIAHDEQWKLGCLMPDDVISLTL